MKKVEKGEFGYLAYKKSRNMIKTIIAFAVVLVIFIIGFIIWKSKNNYLTMLAVVLVLPAAKFAVSYFVLIPHKNCDKELKSAIEERKGELNSVYDLVVSNKQKPVGIMAAVISDNQILAYTSAAMEFDSTTQKLGCPSCGMQIDVREYEEKYSQNSTQGEYDKEMKMYHCNTCGAELVADEYTSATFCSFCGNPTLVEDRLKGEFKPSTIIPFKINKDKAVEIYKNWCKKGPLTPSALSRNSTIEKISGLYVPYWLYDYSAQTDMHANAERVRTTRKGDTEYIYTDHFQVFRNISAKFEKIPADASEKMPDDAMDKLEPFNYNELTAFSMPYLSGYLSERYNYTADQIQERATRRADKYITDIAMSTITGYSSVNIIHNDITMRPTGSQYALFPVWVLNYRFNRKNFQFMLNGQTGKIVADRPISGKKAFGFGAGIFIVTLIITMFGGLLFI